MSKVLAKNFSLYTVGQLLTQLLSIILLPLYLKKLTVEEYGIVASLMTAATLLNAIMQYGAGPAIMRYYYIYNVESRSFKGFFTSILLFNFCANIVLLSIIYLTYQNVFAFILPEIDISTYIIYVVFYSFFFSFPILNLSLFRVESKPVSFLLFSLTQFILSFAFIYYMVAILNEGALGKIKGEFWARLPLFVFGFYLFKKYIDFSAIKIKYIKEGLKYGIPLMFQAILWWGLYKMDYFLISRELGNEGVGLFNVGFQVSYLLITLGISFSLAWTPHFFSIAENKDTKKLYGNLIGNFFMLLSLLGILAILFVSDVLVFLGAKEYLIINAFLPYLILGAIFQGGYYMVQQLLFYTKNTYLIPLILGGFLIIIFSLEFLLLPIYGLIGISIIKAIGFICIFVTTLLVGKKKYYFKLNYQKINVVLLLLAFNGIVIFFVNMIEFGIFIKSIYFLVNLIIVWGLKFFTRDETTFINKMIKRK